MDTTQSTPPDAEEPGQTGHEGPSPADLFETAAERVLAVDGPAERAAAITALLKAVEGRQKELTETRRKDVRTLRKSWTLAKVSAEIGLSVPRVDQIAKGK